MKIAIAGATGLTGSLCLELLLNDSRVTEIFSIGRRKTGISNPKLTEAILNNGEFDQSLSIDAFICCLGTTIKKAGSQENFKKVDHDLPIELAKKLKARGCQSAAVISALGADSHSAFFYNRVKGMMEEDMREIGLKSLTILRPSLIKGERKEARLGEKSAEIFLGIASPLFIGPLKKIKVTEAEDIAKALLVASLDKKEGTFIFTSQEIKVLASSESDGKL
jgi:uncharacterized protein YbjT (DUF2867 family)